MAEVLREPVPEMLAVEDRIQLGVWADILGLLARLHDREADPELIDGLRDLRLDEVFGDLLTDPDAVAVANGFAAMLDELPRQLSPEYLDELAADFADTYLNHGFRASPAGSVWLTEDHLERQQPMFDVRDWYSHYGISVPNWRLRSDDHIVHEIEFLKHLLALGTASAAQDAARFLDLHMLPWIPDFSTRIAQHTREPFHAMANLLTSAALRELRCTLEAVTGLTPEVVSNAWKLEAERALRAAAVPELDGAYIPGLAESW